MNTTFTCVMYWKMTDWEKILIDKWLWETLSFTLKILPYANSDQIGIMLYSVNPEIACIDLWLFIGHVNKKIYFIANGNSFFNGEYLIQTYKLWKFIDCVNTWAERLPIYEVDINELIKYDLEWIEKFLKSNNIIKLKNIFNEIWNI